MEIVLREPKSGQDCDIVTETLADGIHDKVCGMPAESVVVGKENKIAFCSTHANDILRHVSQTHSVPRFFGRGHIGTLSEDRVNIRGDNSVGEVCECPECAD